jgi:hypothetical protein
LSVHSEKDDVRAEPFQDIAIPLGRLWWEEPDPGPYFQVDRLMFLG